MARKNLLAGLMSDAAPETKSATGGPPDSGPTRVDPQRPRYSGGAIGAVGQSIADLKSRAMVELDPDLIDEGGLLDRIEESRADHDKLVASIREYGLQVPLLVRPHPDEPGRFQIVYGRRRLLALRALGMTARVLVRDLDDAGVVMAQGQENSARRDLSFIEKCTFAAQMRMAGYDRKAICDALSVDKTLISRMFQVADRVPFALVEAIGSAPGIGRDRWSDMAARLVDGLAADEYDIDDLRALAAVHPSPTSGQSGSDARFEIVYRRIKRTPADIPRADPQPPARPGSETVKTSDGEPIASVTRRPKSVVITLPRHGAFDDWLADNLSRIHADWVADARPDGDE